MPCASHSPFMLILAILVPIYYSSKFYIIVIYVLSSSVCDIFLLIRRASLVTSANLGYLSISAFVRSHLAS